MIFRKAEKREAGEVLGLYRSVLGTPFCAWNDLYPGEDTIEDDLRGEDLFVLEEDGEIVGAVSIVPENEMDPASCWKVRENAGEFARVVIRPDRQGRGLSRLLVKGILEEFKRRGTGAVHISVVKTNVPANRLYRSFGFDFCGEAEMYGNSFWLCEKII